jgi:hypothetical protein
MKKIQIWIITLVIFLFQSCYYKKVMVTSEEKRYIQYKNDQQYVYESNTGNIDTVSIYKNYPNGYEPNFDKWWKKRMRELDTISEKRYFAKKFSTNPNYKKNESKTQNINLAEHILYVKKDNDDGLMLEIYDFEEKYLLTGNKGNRFSFTKYCKNNEFCVRKIIYEEGKGIVLVEKGNGDTWKLLSKIK